MKHLRQLIALAALALMASCGDFYTFQEPDTTEAIAMRVDQDTAFLMVGDTLPLRVSFAPENPNGRPVFWQEQPSDSGACGRIVSDTLYGQQPGEMDAIAIYATGTLRDTCHVVVLDKWEKRDRSHDTPYDMVVYAVISVQGQPWDPASQTVVALVRGRQVGMAEMHEAHGVRYAQLRLWSIDAENVGPVTFLCYDRRRHMLYRAASRPDYTALSALGTLSALYPITF